VYTFTVLLTADCWDVFPLTASAVYTLTIEPQRMLFLPLISR
jgi:hypothetical protein